jgi:hypothetical protein
MQQKQIIWQQIMQNLGLPIRFFNRPHTVQGLQLVAMVFSMLGVIFSGTDTLGTGGIRPSTFYWCIAAIVFSVMAGILARGVRFGTRPFLAGTAVGLLYLGTVWVLAKTGG